MSYNRSRGGFFNQNAKDNGAITENEDELSEKIKNQIPLITGPSGTGKTQLAKVISSHCGYKPMVVNSYENNF